MLMADALRVSLPLGLCYKGGITFSATLFARVIKNGGGPLQSLPFPDLFFQSNQITPHGTPTCPLGLSANFLERREHSSVFSSRAFLPVSEGWPSATCQWRPRLSVRCCEDTMVAVHQHDRVNRSFLPNPLYARYIQVYIQVSCYSSTRVLSRLLDNPFSCFPTTSFRPALLAPHRSMSRAPRPLIAVLDSA